MKRKTTKMSLTNKNCFNYIKKLAINGRRLVNTF